MRIQYTPINGQPTAITFDTPPDENELVEIRPKEHVSEALDGSRRVVHYANIYTLKQSFSMLSRDFINRELRPFFIGHALLGKEFNYYPSDANGGFFRATLEKRRFTPKKNRPTIDRYDIEFVLRLKTAAPILDARSAILFWPTDIVPAKLEIGDEEFYAVLETVGN